VVLAYARIHAAERQIARRTAVAERHWKEQWEDESHAEYEVLRALPLEERRRRIAKRQFGSYYMIWDAIAAKRDLPPVAWQLFEFLKSHADYLHRYHCARALLALMDYRDLQAADLSVEHMNPSKNLATIEALLEKAVGPRPVAV
jgi:hypothetical protein